MSDEEILEKASKYCDAYRSPTSNYTSEDVYIFTEEELLAFVRNMRMLAMREVE